MEQLEFNHSVSDTDLNDEAENMDDNKELEEKSLS